MNNKLDKDTHSENKGIFKKFSFQFWLVVIFEFFERGAYYGMMSFLSVYFTDVLNIPKENVGIIKGVIQPLLYFLPIISGAIADRFGYRKVLMVAFTLLGGGYFLTSQMTSYTAVFVALVVMGFGAGLFKPMISGVIARLTDESNSSQAFGIYYWSINLGAFMFPLFLVPVLKAINPSYVIIAAAICTAAMLIPTAFLFKEPTKQEKAEEREAKSMMDTTKDMIQTLANAFEIIYSPIVLLFRQMRKSSATKVVIPIILVALLGYSVYSYLGQPPVVEKFPVIGVQKGETTLVFDVSRNMSKKENFALAQDENVPNRVNLTIFKPEYIDRYSSELVTELAKFPALADITAENISDYIKQSDKKLELTVVNGTGLAEKPEKGYKVEQSQDNKYQFQITLFDLDRYDEIKGGVVEEMHQYPEARGISVKTLDKLREGLDTRSFFLLFVFSLIIIALIIIAASWPKEGGKREEGFRLPMLLAPAAIIAIWFIPGLGTLARIIASVVYLSATSLFIIDKSNELKFVDHTKFLLMIFLYSGFWVLYFQMFDSVLWYVQAYVDATSLNNAVNGFLGIFGIQINWFFDVEHVTVINAGTIILLQLVISSIVKNLKALPTMITGIAIATVGMGMLAVSTHIWVFMTGIILFSIGEMTAHPKFISYVGLIAPADNKGMYMGYLFLYGVFGSSIGGVMGAKLYVHFVDNLNQPTTLWLVFSGIGVATIVCLLLYNKFLAPKTS